jgi:hypothetical protein
MDLELARKLYETKYTEHHWEHFVVKLKYGVKLLAVTQEYPSVKFLSLEENESINLAMEYQMEMMVLHLQ